MFIAFEGGEGVGKSTQAGLLAAKLTAVGHVVHQTREPGATPAGELIRSLLLSHVDKALTPAAEALLYLADRAQHVHEVISPRLADGQVVISDRFELSTLVYQGIGRGVDMERLLEANALATLKLEPDLTIILDLPATVGLARVRARGALDRIESESVEFHERIRAGFLALVGGRSHVIIDADRPVGDVAADVQHAVEHMLFNKLAEEPVGPLLELKPEWLQAYKAAAAAAGCPVCGAVRQCRCYKTEAERDFRVRAGLEVFLALVAAEIGVGA